MTHFIDVTLYKFYYQIVKHLDWVCFLGAWILAAVIVAIVVGKFIKGR